MTTTTSASRRRWRGLVAGLAGALALTSGVVLTAPSASAETSGHAVQRQQQHHRHGHHRVGYLALGDSVPFGYRPTAVTPPEQYLDADDFTGYPEYLARWRGLRLANASCPGETTASFLDATAQSNGCENSLGSPAGYRTAYPLHVAYTGSQMHYAVRYLRAHPRTRLVTLMIGANDLFLCQKTTADQCTGTDFAAMTGDVEANVGRILSRLRHRAHYHHRLAVVTYYSLDYADPVQTGAISALNAAIVRAGRAHGAVVADGFGAMRRAAASTGGDACAAGLVIPLKVGCDVHPTAAGQRVLAAAVGRIAPRHRSRACHSRAEASVSEATWSTTTRSRAASDSAAS